MDKDKLDKKRKTGSMSSNFDNSSHDSDLSYLHSGKLVPGQSTALLGASRERDILSYRSNDIMQNITSTEKCMSKLDKLDKLYK